VRATRGLEISTHVSEYISAVIRVWLGNVKNETSHIDVGLGCLLVEDAIASRDIDGDCDIHAVARDHHRSSEGQQCDRGSHGEVNVKSSDLWAGRCTMQDLREQISCCYLPNEPKTGLVLSFWMLAACCTGKVPSQGSC
jgi:hypothetical protein